MRTTKVKFFKEYLSEGMSDPGKIIRPIGWKMNLCQFLEKNFEKNLEHLKENFSSISFN